MKSLGSGARAFAAVIAVASLAACTNVTTDQSAQIVAAVDGAMANGDSAPLVKVLTAAVTGNPDNAIGATATASQRIALDYAAGTAGAAATSVTTASIAAIVRAAPAQAGSVMAMAQSSLPSDLQAAAVTATQDALSPAAGGAVSQQQSTRKIVAATKFGVAH
jgi:hypothetical protein